MVQCQDRKTQRCSSSISVNVLWENLEHLISQDLRIVCLLEKKVWNLSYINSSREPAWLIFLTNKRWVEITKICSFLNNFYQWTDDAMEAIAEAVPAIMLGWGGSNHIGRRCQQSHWDEVSEMTSEQYREDWNNMAWWGLQHGQQTHQVSCNCGRLWQLLRDNGNCDEPAATTGGRDVGYPAWQLQQCDSNHNKGTAIAKRWYNCKKVAQ